MYDLGSFRNGINDSQNGLRKLKLWKAMKNYGKRKNTYKWKRKIWKICKRKGKGPREGK